MTADWREVAHLLELAQAGGAAEALTLAERRLSAATGSFADGPAALHFVRAVALEALGDHGAGVRATDLMLQAADRESSPGWRSVALSTRASLHLALDDIGPAESADPDGVLRDIVEAEVLVGRGVDDPYVAGNAHTGIALTYDQLRLYELALPHYEAAYEHSVLDTVTDSGGPTMWQCNLAEFHHCWALELYLVDRDDEARQHSRRAREHALQAMEIAAGPQAEAWRLDARLLDACARADVPDPVGVADEIQQLMAERAVRGMPDVPLAHMHLAVALRRTGRGDEAMQVINDAVAALTPQTPWLTRAALTHTRAVMLVRLGHAEVETALAYGNELAAALWRQRERTLQIAVTMQRYESLRLEHEAVTRSAETDPLTGVANRRGLDRRMALIESQPELSRVGVLVVDLDRFKQVNDSLGHGGGDDMLRAVALTLTGQARDVDVVARTGGDEFVVLLPGAGPSATMRVAERICAGVRANKVCTGTVSVGVSSGSPGRLGELVLEADRAMYQAKRAGGDQARSDRTVGGPPPERELVPMEAGAR